MSKTVKARKSKPKFLRNVIILGLCAILLVVGILGILYLANRVPGTDYTDYSTTRFIAHRGLSSKCYQNTEGAFLAASKEDFFWGIETDIWQTSDGVWVCCHDENPFANEDIYIGNVTYAEACALPLDPDDSGEAETSGYTYICTFTRYLEICKEGKKTPVVEFKKEYDQAKVLEALAATEKVMNLYDVTFISFNKSTVDIIESYDAVIWTQHLMGKKTKGKYKEMTKGTNLSLSSEAISKIKVWFAHKNGCEIGVWTVNDDAAAKKYLEWGVDYITTDKVLDVG